jgi:hypothetical protein
MIAASRVIARNVDDLHQTFWSDTGRNRDRRRVEITVPVGPDHRDVAVAPLEAGAGRTTPW